MGQVMGDATGCGGVRGIWRVRCLSVCLSVWSAAPLALSPLALCPFFWAFSWLSMASTFNTQAPMGLKHRISN